MNRTQQRVSARLRRAYRIRKKVFGSAGRPRLCARKSLKHIRAQIIDDATGRCLVEATSASKAVAEKVLAAGKKLTKTEISKIVGEMIAEKAREKGIAAVVFDRKGHLYHGRIRALADAARSKGLAF